MRVQVFYTTRPPTSRPRSLNGCGIPRIDYPDTLSLMRTTAPGGERGVGDFSAAFLRGYTPRTCAWRRVAWRRRMSASGRSLTATRTVPRRPPPRPRPASSNRAAAPRI